MQNLTQGWLGPYPFEQILPGEMHSKLIIS